MIADYGNAIYDIKVDGEYPDKLFAVQGETARTYTFVVTDVHGRVLNATGHTLTLAIYIKGKGGAASVQGNDKGVFALKVPQGLLAVYGIADHQVSVKDSAGNLVASRIGKLEIERNINFDDGEGSNLLFDYADIKQAIAQLGAIKDQTHTDMLKSVDAQGKACACADKSDKAATRSEAAAKRLETVVAAEDSRAAAEKARVTAESGRVAAASARVKAEEARVTAESGRAAAEQKRQSAETDRAKAEKERASAESSRASAEEHRSMGENSRTYAENQRTTAEQGRVKAEETRVSQEAARKQSFDAIIKTLSDNPVGNLTQQTQQHFKDASISGETLKLTRQNNDAVSLTLPKGFSGSYNDLTNKPDMSKYVQVTAFESTLADFETSVSEAYNGAEVVGQTLKLKRFNGQATDITLPKGFSGSYNDLANKPDLTGYATKAEMDKKLDKSGGTMTGALVAAKAGTDSAAVVRNIAIVASGTSTSSIPAGTIILVY